ncbi:MAG: phosphoribosylglycinamide formyltransferase-1 [Saprospiraceae bacterium]|jgi:phosphoribosylglycinamide formyltransferase-1
MHPRLFICGMQKKRIAILASGRGSNAKAILDYSNQHNASFEVSLIVSNRKNAGVFNLSEEYNIPSLVLRREAFYNTEAFLSVLNEHRIDMIVLAGFLWLVPSYLVVAFPQRILNIHPALLPKHGGKGMYGKHVHKAVIEADESVSGITIHYVDTSYDEGNIIFQAQCELDSSYDAGDVAQRVLVLEHDFYPRVVNGVSSRLS